MNMAVLILQLIIVVFKNMNFSYNFFFLLTTTCVKVSDVTQAIQLKQLIKKHIYLSGAKSNDPLHIVYIPNVFKFTKISAKGTQESLKWYEQSQKLGRRPNITTSKIFTAPYICNNLRMASLQNFHFFIMCRLSLATQFYYFSIFKIPISNLDRKRFDF